MIFNERKHTKTNDEFIDITINSNRTQNFHDDELKKEALKMPSLRITEIELVNKKGKNTLKSSQQSSIK